jgi:L-alanine-DL-glutamate epimerase-like enolase superfamily enzyme
VSRIVSVEVSHHRIPLDPPFPPAWDRRPRTTFEATLVRIRDDEGREGVGSGDRMPGFVGHEELFVGRDPLELERHAAVVDNLSFHYGRCWPVEIALRDLAGQIHNEPCWRALGASEPRVRCYASSGTLCEAEALAERAVRAREAGFPAFKLRFQRTDWRADVRAAEAVRAAVGSTLRLMIDCNQGWRMPWDTEAAWSYARAAEVAAALVPLDIEWLEEPLHRGDWQGLRRLRDTTPLRIAGGEMTRELHELRWLIEHGCFDVVQPDAVLVGGLGGLAEIARLARAHDVELTPHTWGNGLGLLANAHLAAAAGSRFLEWPWDPPEWTPQRRDFLLAQPLECDAGGWFELPDAPGLGAVLDDERLAATRVG